MTLGIPFHEVREWSAAEILLYQCYYKIAPWGEDRADLRNAMHMAMVANINRDPQKRSQPFEYTDFMPFMDKPKESGTGQLRSIFTRLAGRKKK